MVVNRSALVPRNQRKKSEFNLSYGYGAMSKNASKCAHACAYGTFSCIIAHCSVIVTRIKFCFFALIPGYQGASVNYQKH